MRMFGLFDLILGNSSLTLKTFLRYVKPRNSRVLNVTHQAVTDRRSLHAVPVYFAPQTIGPFNTKAGKMVAKRELGRLSGLFVRDGRSYECCFSLGLKVPVRQVIDVAFALPYEKRSLHHNGKINVGLNVSGLLYSGGYNHKNYFDLSFSYRDFIRRVVERLVGNDDVLVHLVPHEGHTLGPISQNGVSADALDIGVQHALGQPAASRHAAGGVGECGYRLEPAPRSCRLNGNLMLDVGSFGCQL